MQFVPPATFGVIFNAATRELQLVLANNERTALRRTAEKIYALRGLVALRRRQNRALELNSNVEDDIVRHLLLTFGSFEKLRTAVRKFCPLQENAQVITDIWAPGVFPAYGENTAFPRHTHMVATMIHPHDDESRRSADANSRRRPQVYGPPPRTTENYEHPSPLAPLTPSTDRSPFNGAEHTFINELRPNSAGQTLSANVQHYPVPSLQELEEYTLPIPFDRPSSNSDHFIYSAALAANGIILRVNSYSQQARTSVVIQCL